MRLKANLVCSAEAWQWGSLYRWHSGTDDEKSILAKWPIVRKRGWLAYVNQPATESEFLALQGCIQRGNPFGSEPWSRHKIKLLGLESTVKPRGRPRKPRNGS